MKSSFKKLTSYIEEINNRDRDISIDVLLGVSIQKKFIPSIANTIGTDMSTYKIINKNEFAYGPVTSRNGDKISIALLESYKEAIVSQAYITFKIKNANELLSEYLMMWFRRPEFDRYARFMSHGSAREVFDWNKMCNVLLPVPSIDKQKEIVKEYNVIQSRISLNDKLIEKLEEATKTIFKEWFVDFEFPNENGKPYKSNNGEMIFNPELEKEIPKGWDLITLDKYCKQISAGGTPSRGDNEFWNKSEIPWLKNGEIKNNIICQTEEYISKEGLANSSAKLIPKNSIALAMYCVSDIQVSYLAIDTSMNQACCALVSNSDVESAYLYYSLKYSGTNLVSFANGSAQVNLSKEIIAKLPTIKDYKSV